MEPAPEDRFSSAAEAFHKPESTAFVTLCCSWIYVTGPGLCEAASTTAGGRLQFLGSDI